MEFPPFVQAGVKWHDLNLCNLRSLSSREFSCVGLLSSWITGACHHTQLIFVFLVEMGVHHVGQAGLEVLISSDLLALASQSAWITGMIHCIQLSVLLYL